jgi:methionyl-tRNA formyltransferase
LSDVRALEPELLRRARLIAFTTDVIVPPDILDHLGFGAYNFHPGPPHFPGWAPALFAVHHHATEFGVTAHMMAKGGRRADCRGRALSYSIGHRSPQS